MRNEKFTQSLLDTLKAHKAIMIGIAKINGNYSVLVQDTDDPVLLKIADGMLEYMRSIADLKNTQTYVSKKG